MKRLLSLTVLAALMLSSPASAGTNPFAGEEVKIEQSSARAAASNEKVVLSGKTNVSRADLDKAIGKLEEANKNYSELLKKFAKDPSKFADENGDYRDFIKQLEQLSKRLTEISEKLKKIAETLPEKATEKPKNDKPKNDKPKTIEGTVKVGTSLNVRTGPWGTIIGSLRNNNKVKILSKSGDWYKIDYKGKTAYVHANYVSTPDKKAGTTPVKTPKAAPKAAPKNSVRSGGGLTSAPCSPMPSRASSEFGWRTHPTLRTRKFHSGIDLPVPNGTRLNALGNGTVVAVGYESGGGRYIKVRYDNGYESFYCHLKSTSAKKGQRVSAGQEVARSDNTGQWTTGPHLHFGLKKNGQYVNPRSAGIPLP